MIRRLLFQKVKGLIPKISTTELIALRSGGVGLDREIFSGRVDLQKLKSSVSIPEMNTKEMALYQNLELILSKFPKQSLFPHNPYLNPILHEMRPYMGMNIHAEYGGQNISFSAQSRIMTKILSHHPSLGHLVMVPNSLGPGELLQKYGSEQQKKKYLPRLGSGEWIPCFGLTGPENGSDATGQIDRGKMILHEGKKKIRVSLNKRYITLAPIADLCGIAFHLEDPEGLLEDHQTGITLALVPRDHPGLRVETYHNPNDAGFPNGTIRGDVLLPIENVIGEENGLGKGWPMLMECLAVGRGISLPTCSLAFAKMSTYASLLYGRHRRQFGMPIGQMEAIQEKMVDMMFHTFAIESSTKYMTAILDSQQTPSVLTACMKQQTTERARMVIQHGMDIFGGSAICTGSNNLFTPLYHSVPIGITVEGSNTLTRSLIIFGQGLNKSHPYIYPIFEAIQKMDMDEFYHYFMLMVKDSIKAYIKSISLFPSFRRHDPLQRLSLLTTRFGNLTNCMALLGGNIKSKQILSGHMADVFSSIFLAHTIYWYHHHQLPKETRFRDYCIHRLCVEAEQSMNRVISNYPIQSIRFFLIPLKYRDIVHPPLYEKKAISEDMVRLLKEDLRLQGTIMEKLEHLETLETHSSAYKTAYQDMIRVGEYPIKK